jgi:hypothetical protein
MVRNELIQRSPLRILEKSIHGGLGKGNIGFLVSRKGVGKTACLVHIATDKLLQGRNVIHVSFSSRTDHIINWYEDIFKEIAKKRQLEAAMDVHDEVIKSRVIMNFSQDGIATDQIMRSIRAMISEGHFEADVIIVDGYDFRKSTPADLHAFKEFALEADLAIWFSGTVRREESETDDHGIPLVLKDFENDIDVLISLTPVEDHISLKLVKDHGRYVIEDLNLKLDSKSLLIAEE